MSFDKKTPIASPPTAILPVNNYSIKLFPGKLIVLEWIVTDCAGNFSSCPADVFLLEEDLFDVH